MYENENTASVKLPFFGLPKLGVLGVAIATTAARFIEMLICIVDSARSKTVKVRVKYIFRSSGDLTKEILHYSLPAVGNELIWSTGFSMYTVIMGHMSSDVLAANSIVQVVRNLCGVIGFGLANGSAIVLGKALGENRVKEAKQYAKRMFMLTMLAGGAGVTVSRGGSVTAPVPCVLTTFSSSGAATSLVARELGFTYHSLPSLTIMTIKR